MKEKKSKKKFRRGIMPWGKYKGCSLNDIPTGYLYYVAREANEKWLKTRSRQEIMKRKINQPLPGCFEMGKRR